VSTPRKRRFVALTELLARQYPGVDVGVIAEGRVLVDGRFITNPLARVRFDAAVRVLAVRRLRGDIKLSYALDTLSVPVAGRVAVDVGASAGGFTSALLERQARRVYAVEVGVGQLLDRLRKDARVINLEGRNLGALDESVIPEVVDLITMDLSYLAVSSAIPQLERLRIDTRAELVALVKPTFELHRPNLAASDADVAAALAHAELSLATHGWRVIAKCEAPITGRHQAREAFVRASRSQP
jgi:23S rRNA (cytidine1920-2'-O)/16S rRNA (cytidine1409-2'-O)-methyltransferase